MCGVTAASRIHQKLTGQPECCCDITHKLKTSGWVSDRSARGACLDGGLQGDQGAVALGSWQVQGLPGAQHGRGGALEGAQEAPQHILGTACTGSCFNRCPASAGVPCTDSAHRTWEHMQYHHGWMEFDMAGRLCPWRLSNSCQCERSKKRRYPAWRCSLRSGVSALDAFLGQPIGHNTTGRTTPDITHRVVRWREAHT